MAIAKIQFSRGITETSVPDIRLTRARNGGSGTATFYFDEPQVITNGTFDGVTGMYLIDEEGELVTRDVNGKFRNGRPVGIEARVIMKTEAEWERFMRFMEKYAEASGLGFQKS